METMYLLKGSIYTLSQPAIQHSSCDPQIIELLPFSLNRWPATPKKKLILATYIWDPAVVLVMIQK